MHEIIGSAWELAVSCERLVLENGHLYQHGSRPYNLEWTQTIEPKVKLLEPQVRAMGASVVLLLKPLETKLLLDIRLEFDKESGRNQYGPVLPISSLQGLWVLDLAQQLAIYEQLRPIDLGLPLELESQVRIAAHNSIPELKQPMSMSLQVGAATFAQRYSSSTKSFILDSRLDERTPSPEQFLNLVYCIEILRSMQQSYALRSVGRDSIWPLYVAEMHTVVQVECERFSSTSLQRLYAPDISSLERQLGRQGLGERTMNKASQLLSPHIEKPTELIFNVPLPTPQEGVQRQLALSRISAMKLRLIETASTQTVPSKLLGEFTLEIDMKSIQLMPMYAVPSSRPQPFELLLQTGTSQYNPALPELKHIYRLQHLLTGYKVYDRYDQAMVKVSFFAAGQSAPIEEHGRIQLWLPQPFVAPNSTPATNTLSHPLVAPSQSDLTSSRQSIGTSNEKTLAPAAPTKRSSSIRRWFPGFRRNSTEDRKPSELSGENRYSGATLLQSPPYSSASLVSPTNSVKPLNDPERSPISTGDNPIQFGPFELGGDAPDGYQVGNHAVINHAYNAERTTSAPFSQPSTYLPYRPPPYGSGAEDYDRRASITSFPDTSTQPYGRQTAYRLPIALSERNSQMPHSASSMPPTPATHMFPHSTSSSPTVTPPHPSSIDVRSVYSPSMINANMREPNERSRTLRASPSVMSTRSTRSVSSLAPSVTTIKTSSSSLPTGMKVAARLHHKPQKPMLVIFLKSKAPSARLSIVAIQIDADTSIKRDRCLCYNSHSTCRTSCLERDKGGTLLAQRWDGWDLAKLGEHQRKESENVWSKLIRVSMKFEKMEGKWKPTSLFPAFTLILGSLRYCTNPKVERYKFAGSPCACNVKMTHDLSNCNLNSHNGLFGIVKQIGEQALSTYHDEQRSATRNAMVLGTLAEDEL